MDIYTVSKKITISVSVKAVWIYLYTFILGIIFKLSGQRCQRQASLNMESPWQNNPNKFPCGRKQITQETEMTLHAWWFVYTQGVTYQCLCELWSLSLLTRFVSGEKTGRFKWFGANPPPLALLRSLMTAEWGPHYWEELACNFTTHFLSMLLNNKWQPSLCTILHLCRITWTRG